MFMLLLIQEITPNLVHEGKVAAGEAGAVGSLDCATHCPQVLPTMAAPQALWARARGHLATLAQIPCILK